MGHRRWSSLWRALVLHILFAGLVVGCANRTWTYVALGDSTPAGYGVENSYVDYYAAFIEEDLDVRVEVRNFSRSGQSTSSLLNQVRTNEDLRTALQDAEVITIWTGWNDLAEPLS